MKHYEFGDIAEAVSLSCIEMNYVLGDIAPYIENIPVLLENAAVAGTGFAPLCQDTGLVVAFVEIGADAHIDGGTVVEAINEGVRRGYLLGYLRKSVVGALSRINTRDNTPAIVHVAMVEGDGLVIRLGAKGMGSENMSRTCMLSPADGADGVVRFVAETVKLASTKACPPVFLGVGVGGNLEMAALMAKYALFEDGGCEYGRSVPWLAERILSCCNDEVAKVTVREYPTHIAGLPVAVSINCNASRHHKLDFSDNAAVDALKKRVEQLLANIGDAGVAERAYAELKARAANPKTANAAGRAIRRVSVSDIKKFYESGDIVGGDELLISGEIYTARDAAHIRFAEIISRGGELPFDLNGAVIYYAGPSEAAPGRVIGSCGPTTSQRMDSLSFALVDRGIAATIGKGRRGREIMEYFCGHKVPYLLALGGAGAVLSRSIVSSEVVCFEDLGTEAVRRLEVLDFPVVVADLDY